jgi:hypothetical protein
VACATRANCVATPGAQARRGASGEATARTEGVERGHPRGIGVSVGIVGRVIVVGAPTEVAPAEAEDEEEHLRDGGKDRRVSGIGGVELGVEEGTEDARGLAGARAADALRAGDEAAGPTGPVLCEVLFRVEGPQVFPSESLRKRSSCARPSRWWDERSDVRSVAFRSPARVQPALASRQMRVSRGQKAMQRASAPGSHGA